MSLDQHGPILIVDDNTEERELIAMYLKQRGHETIGAEHGEEALRRLRAGLSPCLIILDLMMPVKDGFCFRLEQLSDPAISAYPVILLSDHPEVERSADGLEAVAWLKKSDLNEIADLAIAHCSLTLAGM